jgi:surfeit locus 1 family protein
MRVAARRALVLAATLAGVALTARLGLWQLDRAAQKEALQASLDTRGALPPLPASELARQPAVAAAQIHRRVTLQGRWRADRTVFLDNRQMDGRPGFYALTPLELAPGDAVLVQRGWAPRDVRDRARLPPLATPAGEVRVEGVIAPPPPKLYALGSDDGGVLRQNLDLAAYGREIGMALRPFSLQQTGGPDDGLARRWPAPAVDVHKHYGYAFQWFALALLLTALYVWYQVLVPWRRRDAR